MSEETKAPETVLPDPAPTQEQQNQPEQKPLEISVPAEVLVQVKLMEFDRAIATAENQVTELKKQRSEFIYQTNIQQIQAQYGGQQQQQGPAKAE